MDRFQYSIVKTAAIKARQSGRYKSDLLGFYGASLSAILDLTPDQIKEAITDGSHDKGIDAIHISREPEGDIIHLFSFKYHTEFQSAKKSFKERDTQKVETFLRHLIGEDDSFFQKVCSALIQQKFSEIKDCFDSLNIPKIRVYFISNGNSMPPDVLKLFGEVCSYYKFVKYEEYALPRLSALLSADDEVAIDMKIRSSGRILHEKSDGLIRSVVTSVEATEIARLLVDPSIPQQVNESLFAKNIRSYLGFENDINHSIFESATSKKNYLFWYLNNGITITCDKFSYLPENPNPTIHVRNAQIVNGGQTSRMLYEAVQKAHAEVRDASVLLRIVETEDLNIKNKISESTNSQTRIVKRDLFSNDQRIVDIANYLLERGIFIKRKRGFYAVDRDKKIVDLLRFGQILVAYMLEQPHYARTRSDRIFDIYFEEAYKKGLEPDEVEMSIVTYFKVQSILEEYYDKARDNLPTDNGTEVLLYANFHVLYATKLILKMYEEIALTEAIERSIEIIGRAFHKTNMAAYSYFRSPQAKEDIRSAIYGDLGDLFSWGKGPKN